VVFSFGNNRKIPHYRMHSTLVYGNRIRIVLLNSIQLKSEIYNERHKSKKQPLDIPPANKNIIYGNEIRLESSTETVKRYEFDNRVISAVFLEEKLYNMRSPRL